MNTHFRRAVVVGVWAGLVSGVAWADEVTLSGVRSAVPATMVEDHWNLRYVTVTNEGDRPADIRVRVDTSSAPLFFASADDNEGDDPAETRAPRTLGKTRFLLEGQVAPRSVRQFVMVIRPHAPDIVDTAMDLPRTDEIYILEDAAGRKLAQMPLGAFSRPTGFFLHAGTSDEGMDLSYLVWWDRENPEFLPSDDDEKERRHGVVSSQVPDLPDRTYGYDIAQMVVIHGMDMERCRPAQWEALLNWVRSGGLLVLAGNSELIDMLQGELGELAGVSASGLHCIGELRDVTDVRRNEMILATAEENSSHVRSLSQALGLPVADRTIRLTSGPPQSMVRLLPDTARVLYTANGLPLMTDRAVGNGHVVTLAVPTAVLQFGPLPRMWVSVLELCDTVAPIRNDGLFLRNEARQAVFNAMQPLPLAGRRTADIVLNETAGRPGPVRAVPVGILLTVTAGSMVLGGLLWFKRRGERMWLVLLPVAMIAGGAMYAIGLARTDPPRTTFVGLMTAGGDRHAIVQELALYYSGPADEPADRFGSNSVQSMVIPVSGANSGSLDLTHIRTNAPMAMVSLSPQPNQRYGYYMQSVLRSEGLTGSLTFGPDGVKGRVRNRLGAELKDPVLYVNLNTARTRGDGTLQGLTGAVNHFTRQAFRLQDLPADAEMDVVADAQTRLLSADAFTTRLTLTPTEQNRVALLKQVVAQGDLVHGADPLIVGYVETSALIPDVHQPKGWRLVAWPVKLQAPPPGTKVLIPSAFTRMTMMGMSYNRGEFQKLAMSGAGTFIVRPPRVITGLDNAVAHIRLDMQAPSHDITIVGVKGFAADASGQDVDLKTFKNATGLYEVDVPNAGDYYTPGLGYVFRMIARPADSGSDETPLWQTRSLEVSLEGTIRE